MTTLSKSVNVELDGGGIFRMTHSLEQDAFERYLSDGCQELFRFFNFEDMDTVLLNSVLNKFDIWAESIDDGHTVDADIVVTTDMVVHQLYREEQDSDSLTDKVLSIINNMPEKVTYYGVGVTGLDDLPTDLRKAIATSLVDLIEDEVAAYNADIEDNFINEISALLASNNV